MLASLYASLLADVPGIYFHAAPSPDFEPNYWLSTITIDPSLTGGLTPDAVRLHLESLNIESRLLWKPMHMQPVFAGAPAYTNGGPREHPPLRVWPLPPLRPLGHPRRRPPHRQRHHLPPLIPLKDHQYSHDNMRQASTPLAGKMPVIALFLSYFLSFILSDILLFES